MIKINGGGGENASETRLTGEASNESGKSEAINSWGSGGAVSPSGVHGRWPAKVFDFEPSKSGKSHFLWG